MTSTPLADLSSQHAVVADEIAEGWQRVLAKPAFIGGPQITKFEAAAFIRTAQLGAGALVREERTVGDFALVGMDAVVTP